MSNPLLSTTGLPAFSQIEPKHVVPAVKEVLANYRATVEKLLADNTVFSWDNLCQPLAEAGDKLSRVWSPVSHLNSVKNSAELREAYEQSLPLLSEFSTWMGQHEGLYQAYKSIKESADFALLTQPQKKPLRMHYVTLNYPVSVYQKRNNSVLVKSVHAYQN